METNNALLYLFIGIFIIIGALLPYIQRDFQTDVTDNDVQGFGSKFVQEDVGVLDVFISIFSMFFWSFGNIPVIIDLIIFMPMRIMVFIFIYDKIRGIA